MDAQSSMRWSWRGGRISCFHLAKLIRGATELVPFNNDLESKHLGMGRFKIYDALAHLFTNFTKKTFFTSFLFPRK